MTGLLFTIMPVIALQTSREQVPNSTGACFSFVAFGKPSCDDVFGFYCHIDLSRTRNMRRPRV